MPRPFFFNDPATTEIYTLSLHDALPIFQRLKRDDRLASNPKVGLRLAELLRAALDRYERARAARSSSARRRPTLGLDRKSTRLNSSHSQISYAVFCLKKKNELQLSPTVC